MSTSTAALLIVAGVIVAVGMGAIVAVRLLGRVDRRAIAAETVRPVNDHGHGTPSQSTSGRRIRVGALIAVAVLWVIIVDIGTRGFWW